MEQTEFGELTLPQLEHRANMACTEMNHHEGSALQVAIEAGRLLNAIQSKLQPGVTFQQWVEGNFKHSLRWAFDYKKIANAPRCILDKAVSIRHALELISEAKVNRDDTDPRIDQAVEMMLKGVTRKYTTSQLGLSAKRVRNLFYEIVVPQWNTRDWMTEVKQSRCPVMQAARLAYVIKAQSPGKPWFETVAESLELSPSLLSKAIQVLRNGVPELIEAVDNCEISPRVATEVVRFPKDQQVKELAAKISEKRNGEQLSVLDDFRRRTSQLLDQKLGFEQTHGSTSVLYREIARKAAESGELCDLIHYHKTMAEWCAFVAGQFEEYQECSQQIREQKTT